MFVVNTDKGYLVDLKSMTFSNLKEDACEFSNSIGKSERREIYKKLIENKVVCKYWYEN